MTSDTRSVGRFFDAYWKQRHIRGLDPTHLFAGRATEKAYSLVSRLAGARVLEIGAGEGYDLERLSLSGATAVGIDLSRISLDLAGSRCPECSLVAMDGSKLGFRDSVFDVVFARTLLMHVEKKSLLRECRRVLRPGGKAIFIEPNQSNPLLLPYRAALSSGRRIGPEYLRSRDVRLMHDTFKCVRIWRYYLFSVIAAPVISLAPYTRRFFLPLEWLEMGLLFLMPYLRSFCWISVIECVR